MIRPLLASVLTVFIPLTAAGRPNVLIVLTDDLGYSDVGCYGSEIETPTLDRLASKGLRFSQFYNTAKCHSSRVSLLSGRWCRQAGDESLARAITLPEVLRPAGYFTAMSGKWHLKIPQPLHRGLGRHPPAAFRRTTEIRAAARRHGTLASAGLHSGMGQANGRSPRLG
jgi:arylsulfatase